MDDNGYDMGAMNKLESWDKDTHLLDIPLEELAATIGLGRPMEKLPNKAVPMVRAAYITALKRLTADPSEENFKKYTLLAPIILIRSGKEEKTRDVVTNIKAKLLQIQEDNWSKFTVGAFVGRVKNANKRKTAAGRYTFKATSAAREK